MVILILRVFLNLLAATAGGQLSRARAFLDRFHNFAPSTELVIAKESSVLTEYVATEKRAVINVAIGYGKLKALRRTWWENANLPGAVRNSQSDVYLTFSHYLPNFNFPKIPTVVGVSNLAPFSAEAHSEETFLINLKLAALRRTIVSSARRASCVIALSETCREVLEKNGIPHEKIVVVRNGVDSHWADDSLSNSKISMYGVVRPFVLYVSHVHRYKNFARLIDAYASMSIQTKASHQLVLIGKPHDFGYFNEIITLIEKLGLAHDVILIPGLNSDQLKTFYRAAKLFVFPSLIENSPNILLEAMATGLPVAVSRLAPMPEYCENAAEYFNPLDVCEMSQKIELLLMSPSRLSILKGLSHVQASKFSWDHFVVEVIRQLEAALKNK